MKRKTLIVNYAWMKPGGIEVGLSKLMKYFIKEGWRVIWLTNKDFYNNASFLDITHSDAVEKIFVPRYYYFYTWYDRKIKLSAEDGDIYMLSFRPDYYVLGETSRRKRRDIKSFTHLLVLAHYRDDELYPDQRFTSQVQSCLWFKYMQKMLGKINSTNSIRAFSLKHLSCYENYYKFKIDNKRDKLFPVFDIEENLPEYVMPEVDNRSKSFEIITCSRFEFPHKGYLIGLIDAYCTLKKEFSQLKLRIIGFGRDEKLLVKKIESLDGNIRKDIYLMGEIEYDRIFDYFRKADCFVGLAGAVMNAGLSGIPCLIVRHYSYSCECYGYIENCKERSLDETEGNCIIDYIKDIIECPYDEFITHCNKAIESAKERMNEKPSVKRFLDNKGSEECVITEFDIWIAKLLVFFSLCKKR